MASAIFRAFRDYKEELEEKSKLLAEEKAAREEEYKRMRKVDEDLVFKVQLATSSQEVDPKPENFKGLEGVEYYEAGGLFRYTYGIEKSWEEASKLQEEVRSAGYEDAFIIAFYNGKRIAVGEAVRLLKKDIN
jgi:N-acetylmuramoyl-L-alanine amidase